jgi:hypothetical protein
MLKKQGEFMVALTIDAHKFVRTFYGSVPGSQVEASSEAFKDKLTPQ